MKDGLFRCCAVGDSFLIDNLARQNEQMIKLRDTITSSDVAVTNVEATLHKFEPDIYPARESGGDWAAASPEILEDLKWLGFNLYSAPNNHSMDYLHNGVLRTVESFEKAKVTYAGIGENLSKAAQPHYILTPKGRVALIALNLTFEKWHPAGEQRRDCAGRPGINYVSHLKTYVVDRESYNGIVKLAKDFPNLAQLTDECIRMGDVCYKCGEAVGTIETKACEEDVRRLCDNISQARRQADFVLVSVHSHENLNGDPTKPAEFERVLAKTCIDSGADAYICHGAHIVRGIEVYNGRPIIYSLGNFFYQCELIERAPTEFYHKFFDFDEKAGTADVFDYRENNGGILGENNSEYYQSILVEFALDADRNLAGLTIHPVDLDFNAPRSRKGTPRLAEGSVADKVFEDMIERSKDYGTKFVRNENTLKIEL